jgi:hypothetical protein
MNLEKKILGKINKAELCLIFKKICKNFYILCHIESLDACIEY